MAIDINGSRKDYPIRCKWYKGEFIEKMKLKKEAKCQGLFYCRDIGSFTSKYNTELPGKPLETTGTIETLDYVGDLRADDYISYGNYIWLVTEIEANDDNDAKRYTRRPLTVTRISLRR